MNWEYKIIEAGYHSDQKEVNDIIEGLGKEGFEMVGLVNNDFLVSTMFYFKRPQELSVGFIDEIEERGTGTY